MVEAAVGIGGFFVCSFRCRFICRAFRASGSLFLIFGLKTNTQKHKYRTGKIHIFFLCLTVRIAIYTGGLYI